MAKKFVRNITNTKLTGDNKEPLYTNVQNDILSDDKDIYIRNQDEYFPLTKSILSITSSDNSVKINRKNNTVDLTGVSSGGGSVDLEGYLTEDKADKKYISIDEKIKSSITIFYMQGNKLSDMNNFIDNHDYGLFTINRAATIIYKVCFYTVGIDKFLKIFYEDDNIFFIGTVNYDDFTGDETATLEDFTSSFFSGIFETDFYTERKIFKKVSILDNDFYVVFKKGLNEMFEVLLK